MVLDFQEVVFLAQNFLVNVGHRDGFFHIATAVQMIGRLATHTGRQTDDAFTVLAEQLVINAGTVVKPLHITLG